MSVLDCWHFWRSWVRTLSAILLTVVMGLPWRHPSLRLERMPCPPVAAGTVSIIAWAK